ncbi:uncharacterized protein LOC111362070 [Spodoptera litura]|uniref:Uncharacterized protein LOC111362070 n=1 Tax=Spodoptera litura TaxID=69820 RepID=A0A9J7ESF4_SPOLT|nr:uncharacterized protein LOC111362070 [Spodoptera litura]
MDKSPSNLASCASPIKSSLQTDFTIEVVSTPEIQKWMASIEQQLNEVCSIATEGKLNSEQKLKITNLSRKIGSSVSQMAVLYQSLKQKSRLAINIIDDLKERRDLADQISEIKNTIKDSTGMGNNNSFADMVKKGKNFVRPNNLSSVAIYPVNPLVQSSDETKTIVQKIIRPDELKLHVRGLRKTQNGGVIISTETKEDAEKVKDAVQLSSSGLTTDEPKKRQPRLTVVGVPSSMSDAEVFKCIYEQNVADKFSGISMESFLKDVKLSHKSGRKDAPACNYIIQVSGKIRKALISQERLYINWTSCPVRDFTLVTRCYKCQQYGHAAKTCREPFLSCGHCGEVGHAFSECKKTTESPKCATCTRYSKPNKHKTGDAECPARKIAEYRFINSIDYEGA